ncbi:MAG: hypothetical protein IT318_20375 [Anaerolineales bacterium]|nr:hypothetical protein [Anaerolineales bacterium]
MAIGQHVTQVQLSFQHGSNRDVDASAEQLTATSVKCNNGIILRAASTNTGIIYVGNSSAVTAGSDGATDGFPLSAGDALTLEVMDPSTIYVIGSAANQVIYWAGT